MAELQDSLHTHQQSAKTTGGKTLELLAPAGTFEAFRAALAAGADAIYCGLGSFNARRNAENFTLEDFTQATRLAHLAGSRVYVTINILIREDELVQALKLVYECACAGADAFIVQDWGLLNLIHELWPALELHLSTQANVHDPLGVKFAEQQGCKRVTISRELTLQELLACSQVGPDIEAFGHGAICICYSGECLLSSMQRGRSANRGLCRQPCRLPYILSDSQGKTCAVIDGSRLLSPRDYCSIDNICDLVRSGVRSLKIEGRMKAPDYVASVVETYRKVIDEYESSGEPLRASEEAHRTLARAFNRDFTNGYLFGVHDNSIMSYERGNNRGQLVGSVVKSQGKQITVKLTEPVFTGDLLEIRNPQSFQDYLTALVPQDTPSKADLNIRLSRPMPVGCAVRLIRSEEAMQKAKQFASREWPRKRKVDVRIKAKLGEPFTVELDTGDCKAYAKGFLVEPAKTRAVTENDLIEHVGRLGTSPFEAKTFSVEMDENVGMSFSAVHEVRAQAADALVQAILEPWETIKNNLHEPPQTIPSPKCSLRVREETESVTALELAVLANTPKKAKAAKDAGATTVIVPVEDLVLGSGSSTLRQKYNFT
ncbi:MAG: U32 family peptidase [Coriobacteriales bacterium]|nr:U32 family peptidase [Coriobacteriales bacterium]